MWGTDMGTGCGMWIRGVNGREGFEWEIRASHVGVDEEGETWNSGPDRGVRGGPTGDVGEAWERWRDVGGLSVECWWDVDGMSCTEKWRDRGYDGDVNRSKVQEI